MDTCAKCGAGLGVGRFCLNCGHPIGTPVPAPTPTPTPPTPTTTTPAPPDVTVRTARVPRERHRAAAETARRLQGQDPHGPAPSPAVSDGAPQTDDGWFLPGREVDDEPRPPNWGAWVLGALALVAAVLLALSFLGEDDGTAEDGPDKTVATPPAAEGEDGDEEGSKGNGAATAPGPAEDVARGATVTVPATAPPTTDLDGARVSYDAARMVDGDAATAWRMPGDGTGAEITFTLAEPAVIDRVGIVNGYAKRVAGVDWYPNNRRILSVRWTFDDGTSVGQTLLERPRLQRLKVGPVRTSTVTLTLAAVTPPGTGDLGRDYTPVSSVVLTGRPVG